MERVDVGIVGAGAAGLAFACYVAEHGWRVAVIDRATRPPIDRTGVVLQPNALEALQDLGVLTEVIDAGARLERIRFRDTRGRSLALFRYGELSHRLPFAIVIRPSVLSRILASRLCDLDPEALRPGCAFESIATGARPILSYRDGSGEVRRLRARCLAGADGARSAVRRALYGRSGPGGQADLYVVGIGSRLPGLAPQEAVIYCGRGFGDGVVPLGDGTYFWDHVTPENRGAAIAQHFAEWRSEYVTRVPPAEELLADIESWNRLAVIPVRPGTIDQRGVAGVVLIGDAAGTVHPHVGQGTGLGLEDGIALGRLVVSSGGRAISQTALDAYVARRAQRRHAYVRWSRLAALSTDAQDWPFRFLRRASFVAARLPAYRREVLSRHAGLQWT